MDALKELERRQLDNALAVWRDARLSARPRSGWLQAIRSALSMPARALGERIGVSESAIRKFEVAEASDAITLGSLRKLAEALDCELHYALVPRRSLDTQLQDRARALARQRLSRVAHSMKLEDQGLPASEHDAQIDWIADELLRGDRRKLW